MRQTLTLPGEVYRKLAKGAAEREMTVESLLTVVSDLVVVPDQPTKLDRQRSQRIEKLLDRFRAGPLTADDRADLDRLIALDYQQANAGRPAYSRQKTSGPQRPPGERQVGWLIVVRSTVAK